MRFFSLQLSPRWKFLVAILLLTAIATYAFVRSEQIREQAEDGSEISNAKLVYLVDMRLTLRSSMRSLDALVGLTKGESPAEEARRYKEKLRQYQSLEERFDRLLNGSPVTTRNEKALLHKIGVDRTEAVAVMQKIEQLQATDQAAAADLTKKELRPNAGSRWLADLDELINAENEAAAAAGQTASAAYEQLRSNVLLMCALVIVLGLLALWFTIKRNAG